MHLSTISLILVITVYRHILTYKYVLSAGQHFVIDAAKRLQVLPSLFCLGICSAVKSASKMTLFDSFCEFLVSVSANIG